MVLPLPRLHPPAHGDERVVHRRLSAAPPSPSSRSRSPSPRPALGANRRDRDRPLPVVEPDIHSTSASTSPGTGSAPTRCTRSPAPRRTTRASTPTQGNDFPRHDLGDSFQVAFNRRAATRSSASSTRPSAGRSRCRARPATPAPSRIRSRRTTSTWRPRTWTGSASVRPASPRPGPACASASTSGEASTPRSTGSSGPKHRRRFAGWQRWPAYIGLNAVRFGNRSKHFKPRRGRYVAEVRATDRSSNTGRAQRVGFTIR